MVASVKAKRDAYVNQLQSELDLLSRNPRAIRLPLLKVAATTLFNLLVVMPTSILINLFSVALIVVVGLFGLVIGAVIKLFKDLIWIADFIVVTCWYGWNGTKIILRGKSR